MLRGGVGGTSSYFIFAPETGKSIEDTNSNFNQQRLEVIRYVIEKNLSIAINNYNNYTGVTANFQLPKLKEDEWDKIINNVSIISFLQGLNIGGKIYNGYSIITNNKNQEVVGEDAIYMVANNEYYRANDTSLEAIAGQVTEGVFNIDFERKSIVGSDGNTKYFYPKKQLGAYSSIISQTKVDVTDNFYEYMTSKGGNLASIYFTALGRERYGMYKSNNDPLKLKEKFGIVSN